jgi:Flp pilus assembly protein TadD
MATRLYSRGLFLILLVLLSVTRQAFAATWIKMSSPHFELYTNAGEARGKEALRRFEQVRQVFRTLARSEAGSPIPVRVFLFHAEGDFRPFRPAESTLGFYQSGPQRNYIAMQYAAAKTYRIAFHEYVHLILNHAAVRLPRWLEEGTAEFYSTLEADRSRLIVGKPVPEHVQVLMTASWLDGKTLWSVERDSPYYNESGKVGIFYAQSWALVHMLNLSPQYREGMPRLASLLDEGCPAREAFESAFGKSLDEVIRDLRNYVRGGRFPVVRLSREPTEDIHLSRVQELSPVEAELAQAELLMQSGKDAVAEKRFRRLERQYARSPEVETGLGALALNRRRYSEARRHLAKAIELGSQDGRTYFEYAMLLRDSGGDTTEVIANLEKAIDLSPNFAEAHFVLGTLLSNQTRYGEAVEHLRHAASILPRQPYFWHALALAYQHLGQREAAETAARRALQAAITEQEIEMAQAALRLITTKQPEIEERSEVITPESWQNKRGDTRVEGTLHQIDCLGRSARFYIRSEERTISLYVENPGDVLLRNLSSMTFEFRCGPQKALPVTVEYIAKPDPREGTDGELVAIEFR